MQLWYSYTTNTLDLSLRPFCGYIAELEAAEKLEFTCRFLKHLLWARKLEGCPSKNHRSQILSKGKNLKRCAKIITYFFCLVLANYCYFIFASTNKQLEMEDLGFLPSNKVVILRINFESSGKNFCTNPYIYFAFRLFISTICMKQYEIAACIRNIWGGSEILRIFSQYFC